MSESAVTPTSGESSVAVEKPLTEHRRSGLIYAISAYVLWGILPIYFLSLVPASAFEIVAWRVLFSLVFCAILLTVTRKWRAFGALLLNKRVVFTMGVAGALIYVNWQTYVLATVSGHVVEAALGYFINPIVTVFLGVIVQREKLRVAQWVAVGVSIVAVVVLAVGYGSLPWIALILAFSFGLYGLIKKRVGGSVDAVSGLTLETMWLTPVAIVQLIVVGATVGITLGTISVWHTVLLAGAGVITAVPLLFFAAASRRLPLVYMGFIQYFAPFIQFIVGVAILHEAMPPERWFGFAIVWLALLILTVDMIVAARAGRREVELDVATIE
ncbi:EamA family transporter RarD [Leifsonia sp. NPDC058230]|uniref:EamA family transporter RarD n=1 Tax=Leifsonia sp. NPDC058230 TaxID=3346391 RepID=UPI0036DA3981